MSSSEFLGFPMTSRIRKPNLGGVLFTKGKAAK